MSNSSSTPPLGHHDPDHQGTQLLQSSSSSSSRHRGPRVDDGEPATGIEFIYSPSDIPLDYNEACRMRQRSHSFSQPRRPNQSFDSAESNAAYASSTLGRAESRRQGEGQGGQGRLKDHRRRARRAVTLANLDHQQLMLIMSLQLRYLQENESDRQFLMNTQKLEKQTRRALTPTPRQERAASGGGGSFGGGSFGGGSGVGGGAYSDVDTRPVKLVRSHTPQPHPTYMTAPPSFRSVSDYENAGTAALVEYENVDSCVPAASVVASSSLAAPRGTGSARTAQAGPAARAQFAGVAESARTGVTSPKDLRTASAVLEPVFSSVGRTPSPRGGAGASLSSAQEESGYVIMRRGKAAPTRANSVTQGAKSPAALASVVIPPEVIASSPQVTSLARANSYENVDNLSACGVPSAAHRDPLYENQKESLATKRLRRKDSNPRPLLQQPDSGRTRQQQQQRAAEADQRARPKSYLNAVEGLESSDDSERDGGLSTTTTTITTTSDRLRSHPALGPLHSFPTDLAASLPAFTSYPGSTSPLESRGLRTCRDDSVRPDIYAQPQKKKARPLPPRPSVDGESRVGERRSPALSLPGEESGSKSAFHKVSSRPPPPPYISPPCDTDLDDLEPLPLSRSRKKSSSSKGPTYSSPPSYECLVSSRHGSVHSLASTSSHNTADDLDSDLYKQIRKNKSGAVVSSPQCGSRSGSAQQLNGGEHACHHENGLDPIFSNGRLRHDPYYVGRERYCYPVNHPGIHSFPFRKHHPPSSVQQAYIRPHPHHGRNNAAVTRPTLARSYENLDDVFDPPSNLDPSHRGQRSCQGHGGSTTQQFDINSNRMSYEDILHLATGLEEDSDSEFMETVI